MYIAVINKGDNIYLKWNLIIMTLYSWWDLRNIAHVIFV